VCACSTGQWFNGAGKCVAASCKDGEVMNLIYGRCERKTATTTITSPVTPKLPCAPGFVLVNGTCERVIQTPTTACSDGQVPNAAGVCACPQCPNGVLPGAATGSCPACKPPQYSSHCDIPGQYAPNGVCVCPPGETVQELPLAPGVHSPQFMCEPVTCPAGEVLNAAGVCACPAGQVVQNGTCVTPPPKTCPPGYVLVNGTCQSSTTTECQTAGYERNKQGDCVPINKGTPCPVPGEERNAAGACVRQATKCPNGEVPGPTFGSCVKAPASCPAGQELKDSRCVASSQPKRCPAGEVPGPTFGSCVKAPASCPADQELKDGRCVAKSQPKKTETPAKTPNRHVNKPPPKTPKIIVKRSAPKPPPRPPRPTGKKRR
jgi:hypothetical protein